MTKSLFSIFFLTLPLFAASDFPISFIRNYSQLKTPPFIVINRQISSDTVQFQYSEYSFSILFNRDKSSLHELLIRRGDRNPESFKMGSVYFEPEFCEIKSCDIDNNGYEDILIAYDFGPSGRNSSIKIIDVVFFLSDSTYKFQEISSYYHSFGLFRDFNNDGKFEFLSIKWARTGNMEYDVINIFSIKNGVFKNASIDIKGFPIFIESDPNGGSKLCIKVPEGVKPLGNISEPKVISAFK